MKKLIILSVIAGISITTFGQTKDFFNKKVAFGIIAGIGQSAFKVTETNWAQTNLKDTFNSVKSKDGLMVVIGQEVKIKLNNFLSYRQRILLNFESATFQFDTKKNGIEKLKLKNVVITAPIHFMFESNYEKYRPFVFLGSTLKYNLGQDKDVKNRFQIKPLDLTADLGIGIEIKMKKFLLAPEINFSQGLLNLQKNISTNYSNTISKISRQNVIFMIAVR